MYIFRVSALAILVHTLPHLCQKCLLYMPGIEDQQRWMSIISGSSSTLS